MSENKGIDTLIAEFEEYLMNEQLSTETIKTYINIISHFLRDVKKNIGALTLQEVRNWQAYCRKKGFKDTSLTNKFACIRKFAFFQCAEKELISFKDYNRIKIAIKIPKPKKPIKKILSEEDVYHVLYEAKKQSARDYALFLLIYEACLRRTEVLNLKLSDLNLKDNKIHVTGIKKEKDRFPRLTNRCVNALKDYVENHREEPEEKFKDYLFLNYGWRLSKNRLFELNKEYKFRAGLPNDFTLHGWRHTGATHFSMKIKKLQISVAEKIKMIKEQTGHTNTDMVIDTYIHTDEEKLDRLYNELDEEDKQPKPEIPKPNQPNTMHEDFNKDELIQQLMARVQRLEKEKENQYKGYY